MLAISVQVTGRYFYTCNSGMKMNKIITFFFVLASVNTAHTCTTFLLYHNGQMAFGRNYDWIADAGMVCTNQRGLMKTSIRHSDGNTVSWVSLYGSITFNQYGKEFPTGGMNEKGLVVELMWLDGTVYPKPDDRPAIGVLQWIQYQLDNHATIEEVINSDNTLRITSTGTPLHYLVADAGGNAATIEFLDGRMQVHKGDALPIPVLTNDTYSSSIISHNAGVSRQNNSLERFTAAWNMIQQYKSDPGRRSMVDESFFILDKVTQGDHTKWSIVYDISNRKIFFKTNKYQQLRSVNFSTFNFSCSLPSKQININGNELGDIGGLFQDYSNAANSQILEQTLEQCRPQIVLTNSKKEATLAYPATIRCK